MAKLIASLGEITVVIRDDRAVLKGAALKEWKSAATDLIAGAAALLTFEEETDGEEV
jgi:hypothetical protein